MSINAHSRNYGEAVTLSVDIEENNDVLLSIQYPDDESFYWDEQIVLTRGAALGLASRLLKLVDMQALPAQD